MEFVAYIITAVLAYLLGSTPSGFLAAKAKGIDIRTVGSGNIGATNAFRVLGRPLGSAVLLMDALKGYAAAAFLPYLIMQLFPAVNSHHDGLSITGGAGAILGHNYTCWLKFKGGKGVATTGGVVLAWAPLAVLVTFAVWVIFVKLTRYVSVGSIAAATVLPIAVWLSDKSPTMVIVLATLCALAIYKHKGNIQRLIDGTENKVGANKT